MNGRGKYPQFSDWLEGHYIEWQWRGQKRKTIIEFAEWLGAPYTTVHNWLSGNARPSPGMIGRVANRLGDEAYRMAGLTAPDPGLFFVMQSWDELSDEAKEQIRKLVVDSRRTK